MRLLLTGGDKRMLMLEPLLREDGCDVRTLGLHPGDEEKVRIDEADALVFPYPFAVRRGCVPTLTGLTVHPEDVLSRAREGIPVIAGQGLEELAGERFSLRRYESCEDLLDKNAALSAEAAVYEAMQLTETALMDMTVLVIGYGRFGRALALRLLALGAGVWVAARRTEARLWAASDGMRAASMEDLHTVLPRVDLVINTVPAHVMEESHLRLLKSGVPLLELASAPYGFDREAAIALGHPAQVIPALPARYAPQSAAFALRQAVRRLLQEESR